MRAASILGVFSVMLGAPDCAGALDMLMSVGKGAAQERVLLEEMSLA